MTKERNRAIGTLAFGAFAMGAVAVGALAVGALAIGRLAVGRARIRRLEIGELVVRRPRIVESNRMQFHRGRLIDHVHLRVSDVEASKRFYGAVFAALGLSDALVVRNGFFQADELFVDKADGSVSRIHLAFQAPDRGTVDAFHRAALGAGGRDNGAPGERAYHPGYYGAFVLDPDGNNVEAVFHGPVVRSAPSVVLTAHPT